MSFLYLDIETFAGDTAADYIPPPDLNAIKAAANLKDPEKIADDIAKRKAAAEAEYTNSLGRAALDWNLSRIVAIGIAHGHGPVVTHLCESEVDEAHALKEFWFSAKGMQLVGFCARTFDLPTLIQRSRLLGVKHPKVNLGRWGRGDVTDLHDILTFDDARYTALMPRSLKAFAHRFGVPFDDEIVGKDIAALVAAGDWDGVKSHVSSDVQLTRALHQKLQATEAA